MKSLIKFSGVLIICLVSLFFFPGCKKNLIKMTTTDDVNIVDYMRKYPENFSEFIKILDRTNVAPFLNAYGTYTVFTPTNEAIKLYLEQIGKTSIDDIDTASLLNFTRLHIIQDTLSTNSFTDGKLTTPTMYGQFLTTGVNSAGGTVVNRQGLILQSNILTGNGYIHVINRVLEPAKLTMAKMIETNPKFSIFTQALKETGFYDSLNINNNPDTTRKWLTLLAESDSVLKVAGFNSYADLKTRFSNTGNPKDPLDSLYLYVAYHILPELKYVADIVNAPSHMSLAPLSVVTTTLEGQSVLLNQATFNGTFEAGIPVDRVNSDNSATNGVVHSLLGHVYMKIRVPVRVDFDMCAQPEILKLPSIYRKTGQSISFAWGQLAEVTWQNQNLSAFTYYTESATSTNFYWWNDGCATNLRFGNAAANAWIEFTTPLLVRGKYKVWIMYRSGATGRFVQASLDGVPAPRIFDFNGAYSSNTAADLTLESEGFKRYAWNAPANSANRAQTVGVMDVLTTDRHKFRLTCVRDAGSGANNSVTMDFIQFVPFTGNPQDQIGPLYGRDGSIR